MTEEEKEEIMDERFWSTVIKRDKGSPIRSTQNTLIDRYGSNCSAAPMRSKRAPTKAELEQRIKDKLLDEGARGTEYITKSGHEINASKVIKRGKDKEGNTKKFSLIATQSPMPSTISSFWDLIFQSKKIDGIVALGDAHKEAGQDCYFDGKTPRFTEDTKYFYKESSGVKNYYTVEVKLLGNIHSADKRELTIKNWEEKDGKDTLLGVKKIMHYNYFKWPDMSVPDDKKAFEKFVYEFKDSRKLVVHCSAGLGRTGTFAACLDALKHGLTNPAEIVLEMRKWRRNMVQTGKQFDVICVFIARNCLDLKKLKLPIPEWTEELDYSKYFPGLK